MELANQLLRHLSIEEATDFRNAITIKEDPYPPEIQYEKNELLRAFMAENYQDDAAELKTKTTTKRKIENTTTSCFCKEVLQRADYARNDKGHFTY